MTTSKHCSRCAQTLAAELFYKNSRNRDGLDSCCKACYRELPSQLKRRPLPGTAPRSDSHLWQQLLARRWANTSGARHAQP